MTCNYLVAAQVNNQVVDAGADESDNCCLGYGILVDGRVLAQPGIQDCKPVGKRVRYSLDIRRGEQGKNAHVT